MTCSGCGEPILWAVTRNGRPIPLNAAPDITGNVALTGATRESSSGRRGPECNVVGPVGLFDDGIERYMPHHATCEKVEQFR